MSEIILIKQAAPSNPSAGRKTIYVNASGNLVLRDEFGAEQEFSPNEKALRTPLNNAAVGVAASGSIAGFAESNINNPNFNILSAATTGGGWLQTLSATPQWVDVAMPFAVVIGDSIAEGHPALHGRLHANGTVAFDSKYASAPGQLNYELSRLTLAHWYNHGIGSQTTAQILARFKRDALGQVFDPGDGRGNKTLPGKPYAVLVNAGGNDLATVAEDDIKANLVSMLISLKQNSIVPIFMCIAPSSANDVATNTKSISINAWMLTTFKNMGAHVFDLWTWGSNGVGGVKADRYADYVHPSKLGYGLLAQDILESIDAELTLNSVRIEFKVDPTSPPASFVNPTLLDVARDGTTRQIACSSDAVVINNAMLAALQSPITRLSIRTPASGVSGINRIEGSFSKLPRDWSPASTGTPDGVLSVYGIIQKDSTGVWQLPAGFPQKGVYSVSATSSGLQVTVDDATMYLTGFVGSVAVATNVRVSASWGSVPVSVLTLIFGNGSAVVDPTTSAVPNGLYISFMGPKR